MRLVLASASPRRRELLSALGLSFDVAPAGVAETPGPGEPAERYVERVAREKAAAVARQSPDCLVLAADTEVVLADRILGKPRDAGDARVMLEQLSGREHRVMTAVALDGAWKGACRVETRVAFATLSAEQIGWYVSTREPLDKAGAYAIQGLGGALVQRIDGSVTNVIGLPLVETLDLLQRAGLALPWRAA